MHIQDLPIEVFKYLLQHVALTLNVEAALQLRLVSKLFANEMIEAAMASGIFQEVASDVRAHVTGSMARQLRITRCPDEGLQARYLRSRILRQPPAMDESEESSDFIDHLKLIVTTFISKTDGQYDYDISLRTLCDIMTQNYDISLPFADCPAIFSPFEEKYCPNQACLSIACALGDLNIVSTLLSEKNIKINPAEPRHFLSYPIRAAVRSGHIHIVDFLLQRGSGIEAEEDRYGRDFWTIIHDSIMNRDCTMLSFLLSKNLVFPVREKHAGERRGSAYEDALITAAWKDNYIAFNMLLERGPFKPPFPLKLQRMLLRAACEGRSLSIVRSMFALDPLLDPNFEIRECLEHCHIMPFAARRISPLASAAYWGSVEIVEVLLNHGASPNWPRFTKERALWKAEVQGFDRCANTLLRAGADPDLADHDGFVALG